MKRYLLYVWVLMLLGVVSCTKEETLGGSEGQPNPKVTHSTLTPDEAERFVLLNDDYAVSKAEMLMRAKGLAGSFAQNETKTKGATTNRTPVLSDSIMPVAVHTRSGEAAQSPKIYVVSFGDKAGYALFAGDKRVSGDVLAFSDEGDFDQQALHSGMTYAIECMQAYMLSEIDRLEAMRGDSIYNALAHRYGTFGKRSETATKYPVWNGIEYVDMPVDNISEEFYEYKSETTVNTGVFMNCHWGQGRPFNLIIGQQFGIEYPTGCVATAVAQIMNHYKYGSYNGQQYMWNQYPNEWTQWETSALQYNVGQLLFDLGRNQNLDMKYGITGSNALESGIPRTFRNFGYSQNGKIESYRISRLYKDLIDRKPCFLAGYEKITGKGHAWVADGVQVQHHSTVYRVSYWYQGHLQGSEYVERAPDDYYFIHCNWGYDGSYDTWCSDLTFKFKNNTGEIKEYSDDMVMVTGIRP